jgi:protein TonB
VAKPGFALFEQAEIPVSAAQPARLEIVLNVGRVQESVTVSAPRLGLPPAPAATTVPPARIRIGGSVQATRLVSMTKPQYPPDCKAEGVEGVVLLRAVISRDGDLLNLDPINQLVDRRLVEAAMNAVRQWRYEPTRLNGDPVEVITEIQVNFTLTQ